MLITLWEMAAETEAAVPAVLYTSKAKREKEWGRHYEAVKLIESGKLHFWGQTPGGAHRFQVNGHDVIYEHNMCDCWDHKKGAPEHEGHTLCKHMLAAQYWIRTRGQIRAELERIIFMAQLMKLDKVMLESRVYFVYNERIQGGVQENELVAYRLGELPASEMDEPLRFYNSDLHHALYSMGWIVETGRVGGTDYGGRERWFIGPAAEYDSTVLPQDATAIWRLDNEASQSRERKQRERKMNDLFNEQMDAIHQEEMVYA